MNVVDMIDVAAEKIEIKSSCQITSILKMKRKRDIRKLSINVVRKKNIMSINASFQLQQKT